MLLSCSLFAQRQISGTVTDANTGEPMFGVSIVLKNDAGIGTTSELDGTYSLAVPTGDVVLPPLVMRRCSAWMG